MNKSSISNANYYDDELIITNSFKNFNFNKLIAFDTESYRHYLDDTNNDEILEFFNFDIYDGQTHYYSENIDDFELVILELLKKYKKITIFAHNIIHDLRTLRVLKDMLNNKYLTLVNKTRLADKVIYFKYTDYNRYYTLEYLDSFNFFNTNVETLGELINYPKLNVENYNVEPDEWNKLLKIEGEKRVKIDTEILYYAIENFIQTDFSYGVSIASTSFKEFKKTLKVDISFPKTLIDIALDIYRGGNVMPYRLAKDVFLYGYDINSLYPKAMKDNLYSIRFRGRLKNKYYLEDDIKNNAYNYILKVDYFNNNEYSFNPVLTKHDNVLMPFRNNTQWINGKEYLYLLNNGYSVNVIDGYEFFNANIFTEFVDKFYKKRLEAKTEYESYFYKIILNSCYGKFGQHKAVSRITTFKDIKDLMLKEILMDYKGCRIQVDDIYYNIYDEFISVVEELEPKYNPLIASEVTTNARLINYDYSKLIGFDNMYYTDTDSFFTPVKIDSFIGNELGQIKIEKQGIFSIYAPKDYTFYGKCNKKKCKICQDGAGLHYTIKGVNSTPDGNQYISRKWTKLKYGISDDVFIFSKVQYLRRVNKKMFYTNGIGRNWKDIKEYNSYAHKEDNLAVLPEIVEIDRNDE